MANKNEYDDLQIASEASAIVMRNLDRIPGEKKYKGSGSMFICCPDPNHPDHSPSCLLNLVDNDRYKAGQAKCLSGETMVPTYYGTKPIRDLWGAKHKVLTTNGRWVEAEFKRYGQQRLYRIDMVRYGAKKAIFATKDHRWFIRLAKTTVGSVEKVTTDLKPGDHLVPVLPEKRKYVLDLDAIRHGFVFGDGSLANNKFANPFAKALLVDNKIEYMAPYFKDCTKKKGYSRTLREHLNTKRGYDNSVLSIKKFPAWYKKLPNLHVSEKYIYSFLVGLFAADGCVSSNGTLIFNNANFKVMQRIRELAFKVGIATNPIGKQIRRGYGKQDSAIYKITFNKDTVGGKEFFLNPQHKQRYISSQKPKKVSRDLYGWIVESVTLTKRCEDVFCAEVPQTHAFVLEDNLLTGNCFSHPEGSGFFHWNQIADWLNLERISDEDRAQIYVTRPNFDLYEKDMFGDDESEDVQDLKLDDICKSLRIPLHLPWGDQKWRSIRPKVMQRIGAHYGLAEPESPSQQQQAEMAVVLPVMVQHQLVGAVKARWKKQKGVSSYINSKGAWSSTKGLFLVDQAVKKGRTAILCEGPRDALRLVQGKLPGVAILGSKSWSKTKRDLLANCGIENIILCFDQDDAGDEAIETVGKDCFGYFQCKNFSLRKWGKRLGLEGLDPGNMPELLVQKLHNMWARMEGWDE